VPVWRIRKRIMWTVSRRIIQKRHARKIQTGREWIDRNIKRWKNRWIDTHTNTRACTHAYACKIANIHAPMCHAEECHAEECHAEEYASMAYYSAGNPNASQPIG
jgi:hypothetical protein